MLERNPLFENFQDEVNATSILHGVDSDDISNDEVYNITHDIWKGVMNNNKHDEEEYALISFLDYLKALLVCKSVVKTIKGIFNKQCSYISL